ncbi:MAG: ABC transporter permease [Pseudomonadota bacterium]
MRRLLKVALADLGHEWSVSLAATFSMVAVAAPLVVLLGLREGIIGELLERLRADPAVRLVTLDATGAARFDPAWFERMAARDDVAFVHPATRFAAAQVDLIAEDGEARVSLLPTAPGDPVFGTDVGALETPFAIKLTHDLAQRLRVGTGSTLGLAFERSVGGRIEPLVLTVTVADVAAAADHQGRAAFARFELLTAIEDFRDGFRAPLLGVAAGEQRQERAFVPNFRLYAADIDDVAGLVRDLQAEGLSVSSRSDAIAAASNLDANLRLVVGALLALGVLGLAGGLAAIQWSLAVRKRRLIAVLGLIGFQRGWLVGLPVVQAVLLACLGAALTLAAALAFAELVNLLLAESFGAEERACVITWPIAIATTLGLVAISILPALRIGLVFATLEPAHEIRDG